MIEQKQNRLISSVYSVSVMFMNPYLVKEPALCFVF